MHPVALIRNAVSLERSAPGFSQRQSGGRDSPFYVSPVLDLLGGLVHRYRDFWMSLGRLESSLLAHELCAVPVTMPMYVCGLARSGTTLLHEIIASHPGVATHRAKDYPLVYTPYWWRRALNGLRPTVPRERAHGDGVLISSESPDATEEMLWMAFFPDCHDPAVDNRLGGEDHNTAFEVFYIANIRKLLLAEGATRYAAKANYHVARLSYLRRLFPDAKFLIPVRDPVSHIASLVRQHRRFSQGQREHARALAFMQRSGHFEFGLDRRPLHLGEEERVREIVDAWTRGEEVLGWARYWVMVYGYLARLLAADAAVRAAACVVRFEALCEAPTATIRDFLGHCRLAKADQVAAAFTPDIHPPDYYKSPLTPAEVAMIQAETAAIASLWGY